MRTGNFQLPLHGGKAPAWLFSRMKLLAREISLAVIKESGTGGFLDRIADPFWFQAFGCVLGFDWHSSGLTTTVCGALKEGMRHAGREVGLFVCGGKGGTSRKTPHEIAAIGEARMIRVQPDSLAYASKAVAKVDSAALQDGYQLYQHTFIFDASGRWSVVQQGMNTGTRWARRYHWSSEGLEDFVNEPHKAVCCDHTGSALNMVAGESREARARCHEIIGKGEARVLRDFKTVTDTILPRRHSVSLGEIRPENLRKIVVKTYERHPEDFEKLLMSEGVGPKTIRALALISELIYGAAPSFRDPVRFSFAHGGKDGHPYPIDRGSYDRSIGILHAAVKEARIGHTDRIKAFKRLHKFIS